MKGLTTALTGFINQLQTRPFTYQSANPEDDIPLTSSHLLHNQIGGMFAPEMLAYNPNKCWW